MEKVLILGGCGYIGSRLYLYLKNEGFRVDTVDLEWFGNFVNSKNKKFDYNIIDKKFISSYKNIILLAAHSSVKMCEGKTIDAFKNNVVNFVNLIDKITTQKFIYASSSSVYGNSRKKMVNENYDRYVPANIYDLTKKEIDYYAHLSNKNYFGLRLGTVNGYSANLRVDLMINKMYKSAVEAGRIFISNTNVYRPILGINDLCRAILAIIKQDRTPGLYNIASFNSTVEQIAKKVSSVLTKVRIVKGEPSSTYNFSLNCRKFEKEFKFKFYDTIGSITLDLDKNYEKAVKSERVRI